MTVIACDVKPVDVPEWVEQVDFDRLLVESDVLSVHVHLTAENRRLLSREALARMKPGAYLVNTSRGGILDEAALIAALESGHLGGAGLDVIDGEWDSDLANHPLIQYANRHDNLVISPHTGGVTYESQRMALEFMVEKLRRYILEHSGPPG